MQEQNEKKPSKQPKFKELSPQDQRTFVGFFELLLKVDRRVNPHLYKAVNQQK